LAAEFRAELGRGKALKGADMVVMETRQDHIGDGVAVEPDERERLGRAAQMAAAAVGGGLAGKSGVDDETALLRDCADGARMRA
jgi:hypothetical protein